MLFPQTPLRRSGMTKSIYRGCEEPIPRYLYRFVRMERLHDILRFQHLYTPRTSELNDPFEGIVKLRSRNARQENKIQKRVDTQARILSFASGRNAPGHPLMWAHYADGHRGACLKFHMNEWCKAGDLQGWVIRKVRYSIERPLLDLSGTEQDTTDTLNRIAFTKHKNWRYENEWRMVCSAKVDCTIYLRFPPKALAEVILGLRASNAEKAAARECIRHYFPDTLIREGGCDETSFRVVLP